MQQTAKLKAGPKGVALTEVEFLSLSPRERGYVVYLYGQRGDQPHVPDEPNPYPIETKGHGQWALGNHTAMMQTLDCDVGSLQCR